MMLKEHLARWLKGDQEAIELILLFHGVAELWDDLIDKDKPITHDAINSTFYAALVSIPRNGFYQRYFTLLNPVLETAILDWQTANTLEARRKDNDLSLSYGLRFTPLNLTTMAARIIGGPDWAQTVHLEFLDLREPFAEYAKAFGEQ